MQCKTEDLLWKQSLWGKTHYCWWNTLWKKTLTAAEHTEPGPADSSGLRFLAGDRDFWALTLSGFLWVWLLQFPDIPNAFSFLSIFYLKQLQTCKTWGERGGRKGSVFSHSHIYLYIYLSQPYLDETAVSRAICSACQTFQKAQQIRWAL